MAGEQPSGLVAAWYGRSGWLWLLRPVEWLFRCVAAIRRSLYSTGIRQVWRSPKPVVVVGNITVGGTGKTPIVIALIEHMLAKDIKPGVVSRGYGATSSIFPHIVTGQSLVEDCGDEALLVFQRTACPCVVAPSRVVAVQHLLDNFDVDIVISDDGLQHYALARDLEIAVLDDLRRVGNGFCLPAGPLREPIARLDDVDFVLYRGSDDPLTGVSYGNQALVNLVSGEERPLSVDSLPESIFALAGIGQPLQFFKVLEEQGFLIEPLIFADHHHYVPDDFTGLKGKPIVMTEKDAVKCRSFAGENSWFLKIGAQLPDVVIASVVSLAISGRSSSADFNPDEEGS